MTEIPEDVMKAAYALQTAPMVRVSFMSRHAAEVIARAILAERERCANLVRAMLKFADTTSGADEAIPAAILDPDHWLARNPELAAGL